MWRDIARTYRGLLQRPTFFLAVVCTMALGIGANSAIFSVIDAVLLKPLPYPGGDRLMAVYESSPRRQIVRKFCGFDPVPGMRQLGRLKISGIGLHQNRCAKNVSSQFLPLACAHHRDPRDGAAVL